MDIKLTKEVADILNASTYEGSLLRLPQGKLDTKFYREVNKVIELAGGKWKSGKTQAHVFPGNAQEAMQPILTSGSAIDKKKLRQAFYTPEAVADEIALLAEVHGKRVLEPSAGDGNLVKACRKFGASIIHCIELEPACEDALKAARADSVMIADFLQTLPTPRQVLYDLVIMNPPFTKGQYLKHIRHAMQWLKAGGKLFSVVPANEELSQHEAFRVKEFPAGTFKESGTMICTRLISIEAR
jgi:predicted RNA methylase